MDKKLRVEKYNLISTTRREKKLSQQELSEISGISLRTIQRIEKGEVEPRPYTIRKLYEVLEINEVSYTESNSVNNNLRLLKFIQYSSFFLPFLYSLITYLLWKRNTWDKEYHKAIAKLVSLSLTTSVLIPLLTIAFFILFRNFGFQASYGKFHTALILYWLFCLLYSVIISLLTSQVIKKQFDKLDKLPNYFKVK